jgi:hypothetical protein
LGKVEDDGEYFAYFGYGSLVNRNTLPSDIVNAVPATLIGWRRHWQSRPPVANETGKMKNIALLSVHRDDNCEIDGLLIVDRIKNLDQLDQREVHYQRTALALEDFKLPADSTFSNTDTSIHIYVARAGQGSKDNPATLQSYLDVVFQGYLHEFGECGIERFLDTTDNYNPVLNNDRNNPIYLRHQKIAVTHARLFDKILRDHTGAIN